MSTKSGTSSATTRQKSTRRYWRRSEKPRPWWPWGLLPLLGLVVLFLFGALVTAPQIQAEVRAQVADRFDSAGVVASEVASDGQFVSLQAAAQKQDEIYLRALAKSTQCDTWAGQLTCPTSVSVDLKEPEVAVAVLTQRAHPFAIARSGDAVTLSGEVPNLVEHDRILGVAGQHFDMVTNELIISNESATDNYSRAADRAIAVVGHLNDGRATWSGNTLTVNGSADANDVAEARKQFTALGSGSILGEFDVRSLSDRQSCNTSFNEILSNATVRFRSGSATIDKGNDDLLERLAQLARTCPGNLVVEGHTDSRGDADSNKALSLARAAAVRDALAQLGIEHDRMTARGMGEAHAIADNDTPDGRARNRRIAIKID